MLEAELRRQLWLSDGGVLEFLGRATLLLIPPLAVPLLLLLMFVTVEEQEGRREDRPAAAGAGNTEVLEEVLGIELLDCWPPLRGVCERGPSMAEVRGDGP